MKKTKCIIIFSVLFFLFLSVFLVFALPPPPPIPTPVDGGPGNENKSVTETCSDGIKNQQEIDIDCGGNCPKCGENKICMSNQDCLSNYCNPNFRCSTPSCSDNWKNQNEEDADCGGVCLPCKKVENISDNANFKDEINGNEIVRTQSSSISKLISVLVITVIIDLILAAALFVVLIRRKKSNENIKTINTELMELKNYIQTSLSRGYSAQNIRQSLINKKWSEAYINEAFNEVLQLKNENFK